MKFRKVVAVILIIGILGSLLTLDSFASQLPVLAEQKNIINDGDFEEISNKWYCFDADGSTDGETAKLTYGNYGINGSRCAIISESSGGRLSLDLNDEILNREVGKKFFVSAKIKLATAGKTATKDAFMRIGGIFFGSYTVTGDEWTTISAVYTMPENVFTKQYWLQVYMSEKKQEYGAYYVDDVVVMEIDDASLNVCASMSGTTLETGDVNCSVVAYNSGETNSMTVVAAYYCDDKLTEVFSDDITLTNKSWTEKKYTFNITEENKGGSVKLFMLENFSTLKPLSVSKIFATDIEEREIAENEIAEALMLKTGDNKAFLRGTKIVTDIEEIVKPIEMGEEVLIPLKTVADAFALMMEYDNISNTASVYNAYYEMKIENNKTIAQVLNFTTRGISNINLPVAAQVIDGEWYLPLSSFCSVFEKEYYVSDNGLIIIDDKMINLSNESVTEYLFDEEIETIQIYVSGNGNDEGDGSKSNPYKTIEAAKLKARNYRDKNVFINIENGEYYLSQKLSFTAEDSKLGMARTVFRGGENSIINGGVTATGWEECGELNGVSGIYRHKLDTVRDYSVIYEGEKQAVPARYPNRSEENISASYMIMEQEAVSSIPKNSFLYSEGFPELENPSGAEIWMWSGGSDGTHRWHFEKVAINKIDTSTRKVTLKKSAMYELGAGSAYYVANDIKLLDSPGEFYVNKDDGYIYYYPHNKANLEKNIILPDADGVISIIGDKENPVKGIEFENLTFRKSGSESLVYMSGVRNINIENCRLYLSGDCGIDGQNYTQNCIVKGCEVYDIASRGISFTGNGGAYSKNNRIENNHIYNIGKIIKHGDGISMRFSANNVIKNNTIHDGPRFLICVSGTANDATINGDIDSIYSKNNLVAFNDLYNGMTESQDGGAFYGYCTYRNVNVSNRIHDTASVNTTRTTHQIAEAMYNDDLTCYVINRNNLIDNIQIETDSDVVYGEMYAGIRQKGAGSLVENNFVVASKLTQGIIGMDSVSDGRGHGSYIYYNVGYTDNAAPVYSRWITSKSENNITDANNNLYYNKNNTYKIDSYKYYYVITIDTFDELKRYFSLDKNSLTTNPQFVNYEEKDYRLRYDSPAFELGIKDLNIRDIGVTEEFMFSDDAEEIKWLYARFDGDTTDKSYRRMSVGDKVDLDVSVRTKTGYLVNMDKSEIIYESDDVTIANVSENGKITALKNGEANINVTVNKGGKTFTLPITVIVE